MSVKLFLINIPIILWILMISTAQGAASSEAKPNCQEVCGSVDIPYPFGIGKGCYYKKWFEIDCRRSRDKQLAKPYLKMINLEVNLIDYTLITVLLPLNLVRSKSNKYNDQAAIGVSNLNKEIDLRGTPFYFSSEHNVFVGFGCNIIVYMTDEDDNDVLGWCVSVCDPISNPPGLCETPIQQNVKTLGHVNVRNATNQIVATSGMRNQNVTRGFGFLAVRNWKDYGDGSSLEFLSDSDIFSTGTRVVPVSLGWEFYDETWSSFRADNATTLCETKPYWFRVNHSFYSNSTFECSCREDYYGNPYLPSGCQDVDSILRGDGDKRFKWKLLVIGVCSAIGALVLTLGTFWIHKVTKREISRRRKEKFFKRNGGLLLQQQTPSSDNNVDKTKIYSSYELEKATDNYNDDRILGHGGQGTVYKGMLSNGKIIAVKKLKIDNTMKVDQFINEVVILSQINHRNIVKLFGCCLETEVPVLVYEFISNGTLFKHIDHPNEDFPLTWDVRLRIAAEIAGGLAYLHSSTSIPIYHRDIKSTNILLDDKYKAIVSDFGTSRTVDVEKTHLTTRVQGTFGYLDPEYFQRGQFTEKSDVYSFGVVLVELLTGEKPIFSNASKEVTSLAAHFIQAMEENIFLEIIDPRIIKDYKTEEIVAVAQLAKACLHLNGKRRPTMKEVVVELEGIRMFRKKTTLEGSSEIIECSEIDLIKPYDTASTTGTWCESTTASSFDVYPLIYP